jgi:hypothetical protein
MDSLERAARRIAEADLTKVLLKERMPCPYGGGNCLVRSLSVNDAANDGLTYQVVACLKARMVQDGMIGSLRREKELREVGCPKPTHGMFSGWKCKFADGRWYQL